jgi:hypothetical protein
VEVGYGRIEDDLMTVFLANLAESLSGVVRSEANRERRATRHGTARDLLQNPGDPEEAFQAIGRLRKEARDEIDRLIRFLDKTDDYVSRELEDQVDDSPCDDSALDGPENGEDEESDPAEPSLGSVGDVHFDQTKWAAGSRRDLELDDGETGIADQDGLDEQVPFRDWMMVGMV